MGRIQLKIWQKGLILISVPLLFELGFVVCLVSMLQETERQAAAIAQSKAVVAYVSELGMVMLNAGYLLTNWKEVYNPEFEQKYNTLIARVPELCRNLTNLTEGNPRQRRLFQRINDTAHRIIALTANFRRRSGSMPFSSMNPEIYRRPTEAAYYSLMEDTRVLDKEEELIQIGSSDNEKRARTQLFQIIGMGVAFNVLLSILLAAFFSQSITRRVGVLMENALRLAAGNPLQKPVTGKDEIAALDAVFHKMAESLRQTAMRKQEFVSMITHDLRTPLTSMKTGLSTLAEDAEERKDEPGQKTIGIVRRSLNSLIKLVNDLLDIDRLEAGLLPLEIGKTDLRQCADRAVESVQYYADQHQVKLNVSAAPGEVEADSARLEQVLVNLLSNAIKFSKQGGNVYLDSECNDTMLTVTVRDEGRGIPAEQLDHVFDRFIQVETKDSSIKGGSGLGLAICKALIDLHEGTIGVESTQGQGSRFWFKIPVQHATKQSVAK